MSLAPTQKIIIKSHQGVRLKRQAIINIIEFDLVKGNRPRFEIKIGNTTTKETFIRRIGLNVNP